jgi:hypothetical protein
LEAVYLIKIGKDIYKIGQSKCLRQRLYELELLPVYWELVWYIEADNSRTLETEFHRKYARKRLTGEYFRLTKEDVNEIKTHGLNPSDGKIETWKVSAEISMDLWEKFRHHLIMDRTTQKEVITELIEQWVIKKDVGLIDYVHRVEGEDKTA